MFVVARRTVDELLAVICEVYNDECNLNKVSAEKNVQSEIEDKANLRGNLTNVEFLYKQVDIINCLFKNYFGAIVWMG